MLRRSGVDARPEAGHDESRNPRVLVLYKVHYRGLREKAGPTIRLSSRGRNADWSLGPSETLALPAEDAINSGFSLE